MLFRSATSRNIFSTVGLGVVTTISVAATIVGLTYGHIREAGINEMRLAASDAAAEIEGSLKSSYQMVEGMRTSVEALRANFG